MKRNLGITDRLFRILSVLMIIGLYFQHLISGPVAILLFAVAAVFIVTSFISTCPLYLSLGLSSRKERA